MLPAIDKDLLISTPNQGIPVSFAPKLKDKCLALKREAREYYYPLMVLKHLRSLASGLAGKHNVYIPNIKDAKTNSFQNVVVYVPGYKAYVERRATGNLVVTDLIPSDGYDAITRRSREKPGVYRISSVPGSKPKMSFKHNGRITPENGRNVVIADTSYESPKAALQGVQRKIGQTASRHVVELGSYDIFFSPVKNSLGSLTRYTPDLHTDGYFFAGLLADAIERSKNQTGVSWISERGGSVILTQALQALAIKKISFEEQRHRVAMHYPTTNPKPTLDAISELKMVADRDIAKGDGHMLAAMGSLLLNAERARNNQDHYTWSDYYNDLSGGTMAALGVLGATSFVASAAVGSPVLAGLGAFCSSAGAAQLVYKSFGKYIKRG